MNCLSGYYPRAFSQIVVYNPPGFSQSTGSVVSCETTRSGAT